MNIETTAEPIREGLPSLPKGKMLSGMDMESLHVLYTAGQMQDYARAALAARAAAPVSAQPQAAMPVYDWLSKVAKAERGYTGSAAHHLMNYYEGAESEVPPSPQPVAESLPQHIPRNFTTHRTAWRDAITECINREMANSDRAAYWTHELAAYDRAFARLLDNPEPSRPAVALQPVARQDEAGAGDLPDLVPPMGIHNDREMLIYLAEAFANEVSVCNRCGDEEPTSHMDSASFLREYLAAAPRTTAPAIEPVARLTDSQIWSMSQDFMTQSYHYDGESETCHEELDAVRFARAIEAHLTGNDDASGESK